MLRLHSERSRSYPGRPVPGASVHRSAAGGNIGCHGTGVSRGHSSLHSANEGLNPKNGTSPVSSESVMNPSGGASNRRVTDKLDSSENHLLEQILSRPNMIKAWTQVKSNKGAPGIDDMPISNFMDYAREHWDEIRSKLFAGTYQPLPVKRVEIPKGTGGTRPLGIPTVLDRLIQQAIAQVLNPLFDPEFSESSYGFRPNRSAHQAIYKVRSFIKQKYRIAVDADLSKFFDTVNHDVLMNRVSRKIHDKRVLRLIGKYLRGGVVVNGRLQTTRKGVPQGGPLSPLLANILLDDLDKELESRGHRFVRYADDFIILVRSIRAGKRVFATISRYLERRLKLKVNQDKSKVVNVEEASFLGFTFKGSDIRWSDKAFKEFKRRIRILTGRSWGVSMKYRYQKLAQYLRGWMGYYGICKYYRPIPGIDQWIRRRMRMCYWKRWRYCRTKIRELLKLGCSLEIAKSVGSSGKGYWHLSRTLATQTGMSNKWLQDQGLLSVKDLWVNIHYPAKAR